MIEQQGPLAELQELKLEAKKKASETEAAREEEAAAEEARKNAFDLQKMDMSNLPGWLVAYYTKVSQDHGVSGYDEYVAFVENLSLPELNARLGVKFEDLSYNDMRAVLPDGSEDEQVSDIFRNKREEYITEHPEEMQGKGAAEGVIGYDGRFIPLSDWETLTPDDKFAILVGMTCFHYNSDMASGFGGNVSLRARL